MRPKFLDPHAQDDNGKDGDGNGDGEFDDLASIAFARNGDTLPAASNSNANFRRRRSSYVWQIITDRHEKIVVPVKRRSAIALYVLFKK